MYNNPWRSWNPVYKPFDRAFVEFQEASPPRKRLIKDSENVIKLCYFRGYKRERVNEEIVEMRVRMEQSWNPRRALQIRELQGPWHITMVQDTAPVRPKAGEKHIRRVRILMAVGRGKTGRESDRSSIRGPRIIPTQRSKHIPTMSQPTVTGHGITVSINEMRDRKNSSALPADAHWTRTLNSTLIQPSSDNTWTIRS